MRGFRYLSEIVAGAFYKGTILIDASVCFLKLIALLTRDTELISMFVLAEPSLDDPLFNLVLRNPVVYGDFYQTKELELKELTQI